MASYRDLLRKVSIFQDLEDPALDRLVSCLKTEVYERDAVIVGQADPGDALFIIASGRVKVVLRGDEGGEVILSIFRAGDFFGEMSLLDNQPRSASVVALESTALVKLERTAFTQHLRDSPDTALKVLAELSTRLRRADEVIGNLVLLDVYTRVLIDLGRREGEEAQEGIVIRERPTQQELAAMIGTSRETVSRALSELQRRGFIFMQGRVLVLSHGLASRELLFSPRVPAEAMAQKQQA